ncbi:MAG: dicarboxylate/amino acid:cation symporter [Planctomycetota bacterium]
MSDDLLDENGATKRGGKMPWRWPLHTQILIGLVLGVLIGWLSGALAVSTAGDAKARAYIDAIKAGLVEEDAQAAADAIQAKDLVNERWDFLIFDLIGDVFIQGLKLIIVPIVVSSIVLAVAGLGQRSGFGRLGAKTLGYYLTTSLIAILIGLTLVNVFTPGLAADGTGILEGQTDFTAFEGESSDIAGRTEGTSASSFLDVFRKMVPSNIIAAASDNGQLLGLIVVSLIVGYMLARLTVDLRDVLLSFTKAVYELTLMVVDLVLRLAPIGVCFLVAAALTRQYAALVPDDRLGDLVGGIAWFAGIALAALLTHAFVMMPLILCFVARVNPIRHYRAMLPAILTAFSTSSSSATLPVTMECVEERAGVSNKTTSFVLPLGATVNMDGTALYECVAAIFICQAFGIDLTFAQQFFIVMVALLTSIGVAGVPSASIVAIVLILDAVSAQLGPGAGLPPEGLVAGLFLIWLVDRPLDMARTSVNIFSDSVGAVTIARTEGETEVLTG